MKSWLDYSILQYKTPEYAHPKKKKIGKTESKAIDVFSEILMMMIALCSINISIDRSIANTQNYVALGI